VKYITASPGRRQAFDEISKQLSVEIQKQPVLDVATRWNSTLFMLESAIPFRQVFSMLAVRDTKYQHNPEPVDWTRAQSLCNFLKAFHEGKSCLLLCVEQH
jgi:hypothetical protein